MGKTYSFRHDFIESASVDDIVDVLQNLSPDTTEVSFAYTRLWIHGNEGVARIFAAIPDHVTDLNLEDTGLWTRHIIDPAILESIPDTVVKIDLSDNIFSYQSKPELYVRIFQSLKSVRYLMIGIF